MTTTTDKLRAVLLTVLMVVSVFAGFAGTAVANDAQTNAEAQNVSLSNGDVINEGETKAVHKFKLTDTSTGNNHSVYLNNTTVNLTAGGANVVANDIKSVSIWENTDGNSDFSQTGDTELASNSSVTDVQNVTLGTDQGVLDTIEDQGSESTHEYFIVVTAKDPTQQAYPTLKAATNVTLVENSTSEIFNTGNNYKVLTSGTKYTIDSEGSSEGSGAGGAPTVGQLTHYVNETNDAIIEVPFSEDITNASDITVYEDGEELSSYTVFETHGRVIINTSGVKTGDLQVEIPDTVQDPAGQSVQTPGNHSVRFAPVTIGFGNAPNTANATTYKGTNVAYVAQSGTEDASFDITTGSDYIFAGTTGTNSEVYVFDTSDRDVSATYYFDFGQDDPDGMGDATLDLRNLGLSAAVDATEIKTDEALTGTISANAGGRDIDLTLYNADDEVVDTMTVTLDGSGEATFDFGDQAAGNYTVEATDINTGVTVMTAEVTVSAVGEGSATFVTSTVRQDRGDIATFEVSLENTDAATVTIGSEGAGYRANVTVHDNDGDGSVVFMVNTYLMGANRGTFSQTYYTATDSEDTVTKVGDESSLPKPIVPGGYQTTVRAGSDVTAQAEDIGQFYIEEGGQVSGQTIWTAPGTYDHGDVLTSAPLSEDSSIASGDYVVHQFDASGLFGVIEAADGTTTNEKFVNATQAGNVSLSIVQTEATVDKNRDQKVVDVVDSIESGDAHVVLDQENDTFYVVTDVDELDYGSQSLDPGNDAYNATFSLNTDTQLVAEDTSVSAEYSVVMESTSLVNGDEITVESASNQTISGTSTLADGTMVDVRVVSDETPGEGFILTEKEIEIQDGEFAATLDFSGAAVNSTFDVTVTETETGKELATGSGTVVEATVTTTTTKTTTTTTPTTTTPTTTTPTTTTPTTTTPTTETTTQPTDTPTTTEGDGGGGGIPGFGMGIALVAVLGAALLALRE
jgi:surface glycoprotein (TIGR04207 family)/PGF-CTERM protein